ncbi:MAG: hypothetical protein HC927_11440 [Deltaproteobacteria bacterium]|nr:hypothetical protein [Deltaproteobacteria bacterium]
MPPSLDDWRRLYALCDPKHRLRIDELDLFVERPDSVAQGIARIISLGVENEGKWLISGSVGAGKSTELTKLASLLHSSHLVIGVDLWQATGNIDDITPAEILFAIAAAAIRTAKVRLAHDIDQGKLDNLEAAFRGLLDRQHEIDLNGLAERVASFDENILTLSTRSIAVPGCRSPKDVPAFPVRRTKLGGLTRPVRQGDPALEALQRVVNDILDDIATLGRPLVLVDGLDKLTRIARIHEIFVASRALLSPCAPLVYTDPITLAAKWNRTDNDFGASG